ncbi:MAG TPA: hypothetical protein DSN98_01190 [Thermoplasmata archaeon]|jgi:hypothetical protein|nr:MAG TPA: hypothetical protein DSN98_01190 [Thermoplasmata archaeon]
MPLPEKSEIIKNVLKTLISISSRKTDLPYTILTIEDHIKRLAIQYSFLKHVQINNDVYNEESAEVISVMSDINTVPPTELGKALHSIIHSMNRSLGDNAGHFFIKEIRNTLNDDYLNGMKDMGVDLGLMQLESEITRLEREITQRKK